MNQQISMEEYRDLKDKGTHSVRKIVFLRYHLQSRIRKYNDFPGSISHSKLYLMSQAYNGILRYFCYCYHNFSQSYLHIYQILIILSLLDVRKIVIFFFSPTFLLVFNNIIYYNLCQCIT